jgi:hypothetical protein
MSEKCRSCGASILWALTERHKRIPIDEKPVPDGNIILLDQGNFRPMLALYNSDPPPDVDRYKSHFATCKQAEQWRKRR